MTITLQPPRALELDSDAFRRAFRRHPAGVVVITAQGGAGPVGFTATSLSSLSLDPPLVSFGIAGTASTWPHLRAARSAVVNFLDAAQEPVARRFATSGVDRFAAPTRWRRLPTGEPVLDDVAGWLRLVPHALLPAGDHHIVVARVVGSEQYRDRTPLIYLDGRYHTIRTDQEENPRVTQ
ncbi:flavin reductase family protein [Luedemannella helvata]|uniref:Flavin reductase family protein n=1 Tax=Luedemannella helvata TaxID=349315 RepID=A0ABP4X091_9ACTN